MRVLGLDTATSGCSAALWDDGAVTARRREPMARGQAEALVPLAQAALAEAGCAFDALDRIAVTVGPGAFTGLRIALAAARGFALAAGLPVVGVTSFDAIVHGLPETERAGRAVLVAVDSRRTEPFLQLFHPDLTPLGEPAMLEPAAVPGWLDGLLPTGPLLVAGDGAGPLRPLLEDRAKTDFAAGPGTPDAAVVAALGAVREVGLPAQPFYLRPPDVSLPRKTA
ncbi:tRNA (adenosine(37)-N6)-threonylcarbamoyltransferase complex dimerization subunit type 1 TsaB [Azospirillum sp. YIM DDC1]|uniref:tRNA (Adenosine(37)-N6)-threonylcarbamoyltransferase complex dimerization subunit type 1 TsaB n=1 Tax=Azospirillum aestuarii TaxID=2802052 RepID=A0ABS1HVL4_9PROT|nr:tRNA (adenosine(37)-N6)-threonylcarbamoyltransferase complex dimerization subunit type 1 TsaB [Azospirillum aestuarii]MBK3777648.1 tRNA (adenosine(37)-N6)-threonylcarbamoyltransferase complex dimerization subunit type 1 TsaB [Azospirillum brasilense]MBK4718852.1 tRNA (adenosine(37)-N6)-threonylcarbamoyltransferase complex dimerization subunit type 1 TsaB [Azospirillum aestuarii]TWA95477.1 tRNA threonylcarbamoyladenosine biosynthesis protein TsaB [Azospirillum brasilense]